MIMWASGPKPRVTYPKINILEMMVRFELLYELIYYDFLSKTES